MGFSGKGAASGAASGAAMGTSIMPGWGTAIGAVAGGIMGGLSGGDSGSAPAPGAMPLPVGYGATNTQYGTAYFDPLTGSYNQYSYGFDPSQMQAQWDAQSMYDQFMGTSGSQGYMDTVDWQIKKLQDQYDQMSRTSTRSQASIPAEFQGIQPYIDQQTGKLADWASDPDGIKQGKYGEQGKAIFDEFMRNTGGNYGSQGFNAWLKDNVNKNVVPRVAEFAKLKDSQLGNADSANSGLTDLKNQIDYLTNFKTKMQGGNGQGSTNPLLKWTNDTGPTWQAGDNTNPYRQSWEEVMQRKMAADSDSPDSIYKEYGLTNADGSDPAALFRQKMEAQLGGLGSYDHARTDLSAPQLDNSTSGNMASALNFRTQQNFANQKASRDAQLARRGMASSAVNELAGANDALLLGQGLNENALSAANYFNQNVANQFGMNANAMAANNAGIDQNNAADLARRQLGLQYTNSMNDTDFAQGMAKANFANTVKNNLFGQAMSALQANQSMRADELARKTQDYANGRAENETNYTRNMNMYNLLNNQRQQAFGNGLQSNAANLQGISTMMPAQLQYANNLNSANMANWSAQNGLQMYNAQQQAAQNAANTQGMWGAVGALGNAAGQYYANLGKQNTGGGTASGSFGSQYDPSNPWGAGSYT